MAKQTFMSSLNKGAKGLLINILASIGGAVIFAIPMFLFRSTLAFLGVLLGIASLILYLALWGWLWNNILPRMK